MATSSAAAGEGVYPFYGRLDLAHGVLDCSLKTQDGQIDLKVTRGPDGSYQPVVDLQNVQTPFFDMTTQLHGVVHVNTNSAGDYTFSGRFESQNTRINGRMNTEFSGKFVFDQGVVNLTDLTWGGLRGTGSVGLDAPYPVGSNIQLHDLDMIDVLNWLAGRDKEWSGNGAISGDVHVSGTVHKLSLKADLVSQDGFIEDLPYDLLVLNIQGIYPLVDLTGSTVTKTNGFSAGLAGIVDLSDRQNMVSQITAIKRIPLIQDNLVQSEWVLKKVGDTDAEGKTQTTFFLKKSKKNASTGQDDSSLLGVQKKIGF